MKKEKAAELWQLCKPVAAFLKKNCSPHDTVIITDEHIKMVADEVSGPVNATVWLQGDLSSVDEQTSP